MQQVTISFFNARFIVQNKMGWCERESENLRAELLKVLESPALQIRSKKLLKHSNSDVAMKMIQNLEEIV